MRWFFFQSALVALLLLAIPFPASAATIASTTISTDTHWTTAGSPYEILSKVTIKPDATLTIDPGVIVKIAASATGSNAITVSGRLIVGDASSSDEVIFTSIADDSVGGDTNGDAASTTPENNRWGSITFESGSGATSTISHARFRYGGATGVTTSTLFSVQGATAIVNGQSTLVGAQVHVSDTVFESVPGYQLYMGSRGFIDFERVTFEGQRYIARFWTGSDSSPTTLIMHGSSFNNVTSAVIDYRSGKFVSDISNNWWGDETGPYDATNNPTGKGNPGYRTNVTFLPFLTCDPSVDASCLPADPAPDPCATPGACVDNVLFLPGIEGSRLYEGASCTGSGEEQEWEPTSLNGDANVRALLMDSTGKSICNDVYVKEGDVISKVGSTDYYSSFLSDLDSLKSAGTMNDWKAVAYDWRLSLDDLLSNGAQTGDHISYLTASSTPYIEQTLRALAATSKTGKVTIVAHSNGGLVAKALMQKLGDSDASALVDRIILVGVPQSGAPAALGGLLFGYGQGIPFDFFDKIVSRATARLLALTMPMAYHLLPSEEYLKSTAANPIIHFFGSAYEVASNAYGSFIDNLASFDQYLLATGNDRTAPATDNIYNPEIANGSLITYTNAAHSALDSWTPPSGIQVDQIAGWGDDNTLAGINFRTFFGIAEYEPTFTEDGDGTVPVPSALLMPESQNVKRYWINLNSLNKVSSVKFGHANLLETDSLKNLIQGFLSASFDSLPQNITTTTPESVVKNKKLTFYLHSPLTLGLYDSSDNYTGTTEDGSVQEGIPSSSYGTFGSVQYIITPAGGTYRLAMKGLDAGTFSLSMSESTGDTITASSTVTNVPVTASTTVTMSYSSLSDNPELSVDENGDGSNVFSIAPIAGQIVVYTAPVVEATTTATTTDTATDTSGNTTDTSSSGESSSGASVSGTTVFAGLPPGSYPTAPEPVAPAPVTTEAAPPVVDPAVTISSAEPATTNASPVSVATNAVQTATARAPEAPANLTSEPVGVGVVPVAVVSEPITQPVIIETTPTPSTGTPAPTQDLSQTASAINAVSAAGVLGFFESLYNMLMRFLYAIYVFILQIL